MRFLYTFYLILLSIFLSCNKDNLRRDGIDHIEVNELRDMLSSGQKPLLLDVRTPGEFNGSLGNLNGAMLLPLQELEQRLEELNPYKNRLIVIYCRSGNRSQVAAKLLIKKNFNVLNMVGGMKAWNKLN